MTEAARRHIDHMESFFRRFPDVTQEVIVKEDVLRLGVRFNDSALDVARGARKKTNFLFTADRAAQLGVSEKIGLRAPEDFGLSAGMFNLRRVTFRFKLLEAQVLARQFGDRALSRKRPTTLCGGHEGPLIQYRYC